MKETRGQHKVVEAKYQEGHWKNMSFYNLELVELLTETGSECKGLSDAHHPLSTLTHREVG